VANVNYPVTIPYRTLPNMSGLQPAAEVVLFHGDRAVRAAGILDSGSVFTVFGQEFADLLGIDDITHGAPARINTLAGMREIHFFDLEIAVSAVGPRFSGQIGFFSGHVSRNILGRALIFSAFEIGFHERTQRIHLRPDMLIFERARPPKSSL
jgi:hypothetical protein